MTNVLEWPIVPPNPIPKPQPVEGQPITPDELLKLYENTVRWQHHELLRKNAEVTQLRDRVMEYHAELAKLREGTPHSAYEVLLMLANDPSEPSSLRLRAAEAVVQCERPRLVASVNTNVNRRDWGNQLEAAKARVASHRPIYPMVIDGETGD